MLYPNQIEEYIQPITRGDWHVMLSDEPDARPNTNLDEWMTVADESDIAAESYVDRCYSIEYNPESDCEGKWEATIWFDAGDGAFGDTRAVNCVTPYEALEALDDSLSAACNGAW